MLDIKKFIMEVKQRPAIYDNNCMQYTDRNAKTNAWYEVCEAMVQNWDGLTNEEKGVEERLLRNKWRNIRDYFMKDLRASKKNKAGKVSRRGKTYAYHNELLFLVPNAKTIKKRSSNTRSSKSKSVSAIQRMKKEVEIHEVVEIESTPQMEEFSLTGVSLATNEAQRDMYQPQTVTCEASLASFDNEIPTDVLSTAHGNQRNFTSDDDYDKMFLLSLLPSLRSIPEHMKLHIRIQMQQVIASAFHPSNHHTE